MGLRFRPGVLLVLLALACLPRQSLAESTVDLTKTPWSIKRGFSPSDVAGISEDERTTVPSFPISPCRIFEIPPGNRLLQFTLETSFPAPEVAADDMPGLLFASIGENWAVYLNGVKLADEMHLTQEGDLEKRKSMRNVLIPIPPKLLRPTGNLLVVHLAGMPPYNTLAWNTALGFYRAQGYYVGGYRELAEGVRNLWGLGLLPVFYFLGLYFALIVFPFRTQTRYDLYFGLLCLFIGGYYLTREDSVFAWVDDTATLARIEYALLACGGAAGFWFLNSFFYPQRRAPWFIRIFTGLSALIALVSLTGPFRLSDTLLLVWQTMVAVGLLYLLYFIGRAAAARAPDAGKLIPGLVLLMITGFLDIADSLFFFGGISYGRIGFAVFVVSIAMVLAMRAVRTRREIKLLNEQLSEREQRLRTLFEASFESVIVHRHGTVLDVNPTFLRQFDWTTEQIVGKPVVHLFAQASRERAAALISTGDQRITRGEAVTAGGKPFAAEFANRTIAYRGAPAEVLIVRDISHRKQAEDELQARNRELEIMVRAMEDREQRLHDLETELKTLQAKRRGT